MTPPEIHAYTRDWEALIQQLQTLPGSGPAGIQADFFGHCATPSQAHVAERERWQIHAGGEISLEGGTVDAPITLVWYAAEGPNQVLCKLEQLPTPAGLSPLATLLAGITGGLLGNATDAQLKTLAPKLRLAAKELLLVASCRLCG